MVYSIAILDQSDFEGIGRQMHSGTGVDASLVDGSTGTKKRKKRGSTKNTTIITTIIITVPIIMLQLPLKQLETVSPD